MLALISLLCFPSSGQVLYHFGTSFGQIFRDRMYSSNRVAVSGSSSYMDDYDIISTDRGAYLPNHFSGIRIYPNDATSDYTLINCEFTMAIWYMMVPDSNGILFQRKMNQGDYFYVYHYGIGDYFYIYYCKSTCISQTTQNLNKSKRNFYLAVWVLFGFVINNNIIEIYIDDSQFFTLNIVNNHVETSVENLSIGSAGNWYGTIGFIWYYYHNYNIGSFTSFIQKSTSWVCLNPGCSSCNPSIVDPILQNSGCTSYDTDPYIRSNAYCSDYLCSSGCIGSFCLTCDCIPSSCLFKPSGSICDCDVKFFN